MAQRRRRDSITIFIRSQVDAEFGEGLRNARRALRTFVDRSKRELDRLDTSLKGSRLESARLTRAVRAQKAADADPEVVKELQQQKLVVDRRINDLRQEQNELKRLSGVEEARLKGEVAGQKRAQTAREAELQSIIERRRERQAEAREARQERREASRAATRQNIAARREALAGAAARRRYQISAGIARVRADEDRNAAAAVERSAQYEAGRAARRDAISQVLAQERVRRDALADDDPFIRGSRVERRLRRQRPRGGQRGGGGGALRGEAGTEAVLGSSFRAQGYRSVRQFEAVSGFTIPGAENLFLATTAGPLAAVVAGSAVAGFAAAAGAASLRNSVGDYRRLRAAANAANVGVDEVARVAHIARLAGVEQAPEDFAKDIIKDTREFIGEALREAERGNKNNPRVEVLRELGINAEQLRSLSRIDQVALLQERLAGTDEERQQFLVSEFFGGSDERFNVLLAVGAERLREFNEEARHAAFTSQESNAMFERHILTLDRFYANLDRISERIAVGLLPAIAGVVEFISYHLDTPQGQANQRRRTIRNLYRDYADAQGATVQVGDFVGINALAYGDPAIVRRQAERVEQRRSAYRVAVYDHALRLGLLDDVEGARAAGPGALAHLGTLDSDLDIQRIEREARGGVTVVNEQHFYGAADPGDVLDAADSGVHGALADAEDFS